MIKKLLFLWCCTFYVLVAHGEIKHTDFGSGLVIQMDQNYAMDIDDDGVTDFFINREVGELGFTPIPAKGCFTSPGEFAKTSWGARELDLHNHGEYIILTEVNGGSYIDDDRGSAYSIISGLAQGWSNSKDVYVGFAVFADDYLTVTNGWMKVAIDVASKTLTVKELAYTDYQSVGNQGIHVGDRGLASIVSNADQFVGAISVTPNPAKSYAAIHFNYLGATPLDVDVFMADGRFVQNLHSQNSIGETRVHVSTNAWLSGIYFIRFKSTEGVTTERLIINR